MKTLFALSCLMLPFLAAADKDDEGYRMLVSWMTSHGGRLDERLSLVPIDGLRGILAMNDIEENQELMHCPWELVIGSRSREDQMQSVDDACQVVETLASGFREGESSDIWPYLNSVQLSRLGATWGSSALKELQGLPPSQDIHRHNDWFSSRCGGGNASDFDEATTKALTCFISRSNAVGMIPFYDLVNHHNGLKNVKLVTTKEGVSLLSIRPIRKDEQLYLSYGLRPNSQMFRDYGFVESWPSLWSWNGHVFSLFPNGVAAIQPSVEFLQAIWESPTRSQRQWQGNATSHTQSLASDTLREFAAAAKALLRELPTTWREDEEILRHTLQVLSETSKGEERKYQSLEDTITAVQYRLAFKRAVSQALSFPKKLQRRLLQ